MATSTSLISGLASGFDWRTMVDQIIAIDHRRVDLVDTEKTALEDKLAEWQTVNSKLLAFRTAADALRNPEDFRIYSAALRSENPSVEASTLLTVSTSTLASPGSYTATVINKAQSQKLASNPFANRTSALGETYAGDIVINGVVIAISADDTLADAADRINSANSGSNPTGVTASIVSYGSYDHRLILTSDATGSEGITLLNGSSKSIVQQFGWKDNQASVVKNAITSGAQSDAYSSPTVAVAALLGLGVGESSSGTLTIGGAAVTIDLAADSLNDIKTAINEAAIPGVQASVITQTVAGETLYRLQIDGTQSFTDENNILNTLGILDHTSAPVSGKVSGNAMTTNGSTISPETLLCDIDGYFSYTEGDHITFSGTDTNDAAVSYDFAISASTTTADLLAALEDAYGDVAAYVTAEGKIRVDDNGGSGVL
ncbi:MAG: flagellar hook protein, partial [Deltaproteobacteria bacterium]|nr:flagellar hook protein [Deltaproteobacteria bacterium]